MYKEKYIRVPLEQYEALQLKLYEQNIIIAKQAEHIDNLIDNIKANLFDKSETNTAEQNVSIQQVLFEEKLIVKFSDGSAVKLPLPANNKNAIKASILTAIIIHNAKGCTDEVALLLQQADDVAYIQKTIRKQCKTKGKKYERSSSKEDT